MLRVRHIKTTSVPTEDGSKIVPARDEQGHEIELYSIDVPQEIEAEGGAAIDAFVAAELAQRARSTTAPVTAESPAAPGGPE